MAPVTVKRAVKQIDKKGLAEARKATKMTSQQWKKLQVGMKEKWPAPEYMEKPHPEGKGHTCYRDETFEIVTRWTESTRIEYRPHAKSPGSKSHVRYEKYSKAKTVGQALKLGSWPADWCWDYERGFIKVTGGFIRDEPIDISDSPEDKQQKFTDVDRAVYGWYRRELCRKLGVKLDDLLNGKIGSESTIMRAHRLVAQREAKKILAAAEKGKRKISDEEMTAVLKAWAFGRNVTRVNVMRKGVSWVWSDTMGLLRDRLGDIHLTPSTHAYPEVVQVFSKWFTDRLPPEAASFKFTSLNLNKDYAAKIHRDGNNFGPSMITAFGDFTGGDLVYYQEDDASMKDVEKLETMNVAKQSLNLKNGLALFNGNCAHSVEDFEGNRYSVVYFTLGCHAGMTPEDKEKLERLGVRTPKPDENPFKIIRPPHGRKHKIAAPTPCRANGLPPSRYWLKSKLSAAPYKFSKLSKVEAMKFKVTRWWREEGKAGTTIRTRKTQVGASTKSVSTRQRSLSKSKLQGTKTKTQRA